MLVHGWDYNDSCALWMTISARTYCESSCSADGITFSEFELYEFDRIWTSQQRHCSSSSVALFEHWTNRTSWSESNSFGIQITCCLWFNARRYLQPRQISKIVIFHVRWLLWERRNYSLCGHLIITWRSNRNIEPLCATSRVWVEDEVHLHERYVSME